MLVKVKNHVSENKSVYIKVIAGAIGIGIVSFISYRLGAQYGVDTMDLVLRKYDQDLWKQVDDLMRKIGVKG